MTDPNWELIASLWILNSSSKSGYSNKVSQATIRLISSKSFYSILSHLNFTLLSVILVEGPNIYESLAHLLRYCFTTPINWCTSFWEFCGFIFLIPCIFYLWFLHHHVLPINLYISFRFVRRKTFKYFIEVFFTSFYLVLIPIFVHDLSIIRLLIPKVHLYTHG